MAQYRTGGEADSLCTRCKMVLAHTILAIEGGRPARVECNTCHGQHNYRPGTPEARPASAATRAPAATGRTRLSFEDMLGQKRSPAKSYSPKALFAVDEVVSHPTFGHGFVSAVRADKVDVTFRVGTKTLIHGRG